MHTSALPALEHVSDWGSDMPRSGHNRSCLNNPRHLTPAQGTGNVQTCRFPTRDVDAPTEPEPWRAGSGGAQTSVQCFLRATLTNQPAHHCVPAGTGGGQRGQGMKNGGPGGSWLELLLAWRLRVS